MRNDIIATNPRIQPLSFPRIFYQFVTLNRDSDKLFSVIQGALLTYSHGRRLKKKKLKIAHFIFPYQTPKFPVRENQGEGSQPY